MTAAPDLQRIARLAERVLDALDWAALGDIYFHSDGERLWRERRPRVVASGVLLAERLAAEVPRGGSSLWVGAGVAELPVLLAEVTLLDRVAVAANLRANECELLNAGLAAIDTSLRFVCGDAALVEPGRRFDHIGCVSVFTDPEVWPQLSGLAYGRLPPVQLDVERFTAERSAARRLAHDLFARLSRPGLITTTAEEVAWFLEQGETAGSPCVASDDLVPTAVVGDPVGFVRFG